MQWLKNNWLLAPLLVVAGAWSYVVWQSAKGWNPSGVKWDFENTGQLGDSFGVLSSLMAGIAAYYAFRTYQSSKAQAARLETQAAEPSFLNLLERRYDVLGRVRWGSTQGHASVDAMARALKSTELFAAIQTAKDLDITLSDHWGQEFKSVIGRATGLTTHFRFTYHIITFADRQFSTTRGEALSNRDDPAYSYVRLLRAQLSDSELLLIALNCIHDEGLDRFKPLAERYALFHNMPLDDISRFGLRAEFKPSAFGLPEP